MRDVLKVLIFFVVLGLVVVMGYHIDKFFIAISEKEKPMKVEVDIDVTLGLDESVVEAGQIWVSKMDNPFEEDVYWYVIETKKDYVKFSSINYNKTKKHWDLSSIHSGISDKISTFKKVNERVK